MSPQTGAIGYGAWGMSLLLHLALLLPLWWLYAPTPVYTPPPLAVELWAGGAPAAASKSAPAPVRAAPPAAAVAQAATPLLADADIKLKASRPLPQHKAPPPPVAAEKPQPKPKPVEKVPEKVPAKTAKAETAPAKASVPAAKPAAKPAPAADNDLLAELDLPPGPGNAKQSQRGGQGGVAGGGSHGVADAKALYAQTLSNRVRPYVAIPDALRGNPEVVLQIEILPSLEVRQIRLLRSSGNPQYDEAVQAAVREMRRFPPLPKGAAFADYRRVTMSFRPKE
ncbi:cell envelope integrity protein TolA [Vogesella indigofera]|uniref:cell envelope integrity protein TolA n=1 Tax=Vogesella indigofera TaxID=45465 RepID=UPI00234C268B|nr:TonB family protein [Vogesella indigofera]MDC7703120.1 TonB family protein [Vogesella indigofera]